MVHRKQRERERQRKRRGEEDIKEELGRETKASRLYAQGTPLMTSLTFE